MIISRSILLRITNISDKSVVKIRTHILYLIIFSRKSCRLWDNVEKYGRARQAIDDNIIRDMRIACWTTKARYTHWEYVILIACPRQQWLDERASMLRYVYIASLVKIYICFDDVNILVYILRKKVNKPRVSVFSGVRRLCFSGSYYDSVQAK
jgi:hypothetical protein